MRSVSFCLFVMLGGCALMDGRPQQVRPQSRPQVVAEPGFLEQFARTRGFSLGRPTGINIVPDGSAVLFLRSPADSFVQDLYEFSVATGQERLLLTADDVLKGQEEELSPEELARRERTRTAARGIVSYKLSDDGKQILVTLGGRLFVIGRDRLNVTELPGEKGFPLDARFSPDGQWVSCVRDGELFIHNVADRTERQLTTGATEQITHALAEFVAQEEMGRHEGYWWSPETRFIAYQRTDTSEVETLYIMDAADPAGEPRGWPYPRAGSTNADVRLGIIAIDGGETTWVEWNRERYPYLATVRWSENAPLTILVQNRRQTEQVLLAVDAYTGESRELLKETDEAWINLDQKMPHWRADGSAFLWTTERNGAWQLEMRNRDGDLIAPLTTTDFTFRGFLSLDEENRHAYVRGGDDPTQIHVYRVYLDEPARTPLRITFDRGLHGAIFSKDHELFIHSASTFDGRRWHVVRRPVDGREIGVLPSKAAEPPFVPNVELTTIGRDPGFHAFLVRPRNFEPGRKYPVIVHVYGGPKGQMAIASANAYLLRQWIADHGYIVVGIDGRGTPARGREWERVVKGNLIDVPLQDQAAGLKALGRRYPELDLNRVGIFGWSFGGYFSAMAVMRRPEVYHVGVAGAPVADWLDYDTHYTERYMDLPEKNPEGYKAASVLTYAERLMRPLLIIHGTADDNVFLIHALRMSDAIFRGGRRHEFLPLGGFTHMVADPFVVTRMYSRIMEHFQRHLQEG